MENSIEHNGIVYTSWQNYFQDRFAKSEKYDKISIEKKGDVIEELYESKNYDNKTKIKIGYISNDLIYWFFENPLTKGYTKQQSNEHFYRSDFTPNDSHGEPGLDFIKMNLEAIDKIMREGLKGKEVQYYEKDKLIKSKIYTPYKDNKVTYEQTIYFTQRSAWNNFLDIFLPLRNEGNLTVKEIQLESIFGGI